MPKRISPLTDNKVRTVKLEEKPQKLYDGGDLFLLFTTTGGKLWNLKYRLDVKEGKISFGANPDTLLAEARQKQDQTRVLPARGVDLRDTGKAKKAAATEETETFEVIARRWPCYISPLPNPRKNVELEPSDDFSVSYRFNNIHRHRS